MLRQDFTTTTCKKAKYISLSPIITANRKPNERERVDGALGRRYREARLRHTSFGQEK